MTNKKSEELSLEAVEAWIELRASIDTGAGPMSD